MEKYNQSNKLYNIQEPIKEILSILSKSIETNSLTINKLRNQINELNNQSNEFQDQLDNKIFLNINKIDNNINVFENKLIYAIEQISKLGSVISDQNNYINEMNNQNKILQSQIDSLKHTYDNKFDQIDRYIDKQIDKLNIEISNKLSTKVDNNDIDTYVTNKVESSLLATNKLIADLQIDLQRKITKDEVIELGKQKVNKKDFNDLSILVDEKLSTYDLSTHMNSYIKPLVTAIGAIESNISIDSHKTNRFISQIDSNVDRNLDRNLDSKIVKSLDNEIVSYIDSKLDSKIDGKLDSKLDSKLVENNLLVEKKLLGQVDRNRNIDRSDIISTINQSIEDLSIDLNTKIEMVNSVACEGRDRSIRLKQAMKDLSINVAKSLSKKLDIQTINPTNKSNKQIDSKLDRQLVSELDSKVDSKVDRKLDRKVDKELSYEDLTTTRKVDVNLSTILSSKQIDKQIDNQLNGLIVEINEIKQSISNIDRYIDKQVDKQLVNYFDKQLNHQLVSKIDDQLDNKIDSKIGNKLDSKIDSKISNQITTYLSTYQPIKSNDNDWRLSLGEVSRNIRYELNDKIDREETKNLIRNEIESIEKKLHIISGAVDKTINKEDFTSLSDDLLKLKNRVSGELMGARWLWTSGELVAGHFIPWDKEAVNYAPHVICWQMNASAILIKIPGLYRLTVSVFTSLPISLSICVNGQPVLSLQPDTTTEVKKINSYINTHVTKEDRYILKRLRHTLGEITCVTIEEYLSICPNAAISIRYESKATAQAFLAIRKL